MKSKQFFAGVIFSILIFSNLVSAQEQPRVFQIQQEYLNKDKVTQLAWAKAEKEPTYFSINKEIFSDSELDRGAILKFIKPDGSTDELVILAREEYLPGTVSIRAYKKGNREAVFSATYNKGALNGVYFDDPESPTYLGYDKMMAKNYISKTNDRIERRLSCGIDHSDELIPVPHFRTPGVSSKQKAGNSTTSVAAPLVASEDDSVTIDLLIVYTQAAEDWAATTGFGDIAGVIAQSVNLSQTALNNSGIGLDLRLVATLKTSYDEENDGLDDSDARLSRFTQNDNDPVFDTEDGHNGFMQEVHGVRDTFGADIVSLFVKIEDTGGLGWRLSSSGGNPGFGFNLNRVQQVADTFTLIHEIGHNMGNAHSRTQQSSAASDGGGLFHYSAGFQNTGSNYHTVMAYADGLQEAPYFSSPGLSFLGTPTGQNSSTVPTDNARSMREIKRTISNYRDTQANAPTASLLADVINIEMNREDDLSIPFQIFNDGQSMLVWDIDFGFSGNGFKRAKNIGKVIQPASFDRITKRAANHSVRKSIKTKLVAEQTLYSTSFESSDGFSAGTFEGLSEWRAVSDDEFVISSANANTGSQHLRVEGDGTGNTKFISAPFFGFQQFGSYEITVNFAVSSSTETFDIYVSDGKNGEFSAAIIIDQGIFFAADRTEQDEVSFFGSGAATINIGTYNEIKMVMDPDNEVIRYILNGNTIYENEYVGGFSPGEMLILNRSNENGSTIDIDDIEIKQLSAPYPWLSVSESTGFTLEDASSSRSLQFTTRGVDAGTYRTTMKVRTNDPNNASLEVPITLTVANIVSNEPLDGPDRISLDQNYPNPFNPATTISYTLNEVENIRLEVFNIQGQNIATLFEGKQQAGEHEVLFDASNLSSGIYMYRLQTGSQILTRQMVLIK